MPVDPGAPAPGIPGAPVTPGAPITPGAPVAAVAKRLADGEWHRMHPASPLLKGGIALIAILGVVVANLRERLIQIFVPEWNEGGDPLDYVIDSGLTGWALLVVLGVVVVLIIGFYVSWRMHSFRITDELVEVRSGILFRTSRKARLDRIQGINIVRPFIARLFGTARLEINQAGADANVQLAYLGSSASDELRREILRLASGTQAAASPQAVPAGEGFIESRVHELLAPELDPDAAPPQSVVKLNAGRLAGSIALSETTIILLLMIIGVIVGVIVSGELLGFIGVIPVMLGLGGYIVSKFTRSLRYSIAATPDGVRVGFGLLSTSNETLPPGRIHSVQLSQPLLWRPAGWWQIRVNRASQSTAKGAAGEANTTILPVGDRGDVLRVLQLLLPDVLRDEQAAALLASGFAGRGEPGDGFENSPRRAAVLRWFSWRRNGFALTDAAFVLRKGAVWRQLVVVPAPRLQSLAVEQGPLRRALRLVTLQLHTVAGPITARLGAVDADVAVRFFGDAAALMIAAAQRDHSHRWGAGDADAQDAASGHPEPGSSEQAP
ncbi:PH domain-containing protein [Homoserinimonas aerilata]|uniref:PH domain-containing protein n=1 Tax=Homoserinimonas aerilata TaxID=1162970 RepID=UPI001C8A430D|nr:PH domain-containing protein [Homoserinimonas aerilata]